MAAEAVWSSGAADDEPDGHFRYRVFFSGFQGEMDVRLDLHGRLDKIGTYVLHRYLVSNTSCARKTHLGWLVGR